jgi:hypothetical protein
MDWELRRTLPFDCLIDDAPPIENDVRQTQVSQMADLQNMVAGGKWLSGADEPWN